MKTPYLYAIGVIIFLLGVVLGMVAMRSLPVMGGSIYGDQIPVGAICPADAIQCPDGSFAERAGPDCRFACPEGAPQPISSDPGMGGMVKPGQPMQCPDGTYAGCDTECASTGQWKCFPNGTAHTL